MTKESRAHEQVEWTKQKLDEIDAILAALEESINDVSTDTRAQAEQAVAQLKAARASASKRYDALQADIAAARKIADDTYEKFKADWADAELAFQQFINAAGGQIEIARKTVTARAEAQRQAWDRSIAAVRSSASEALEEGQREFNTAIERLSAARSKVEAKAGQAASAGDETWQAINNGIDEARAVHERTWKRISDAFAKLAR